MDRAREAAAVKRRIEVEIEVKVTPWWRVEGLPEWRDSTVAAVRIWHAHDGYRWWICHEWEYRGGNAERWAERWMQVSSRRFPPNAIEPEPGEEPPAWT
jgi:hypothetical protein